MNLEEQEQQKIEEQAVTFEDRRNTTSLVEIPHRMSYWSSDLVTPRSSSGLGVS